MWYKHEDILIDLSNITKIQIEDTAYPNFPFSVVLYNQTTPIHKFRYETLEEAQQELDYIYHLLNTSPIK